VIASPITDVATVLRDDPGLFKVPLGAPPASTAPKPHEPFAVVSGGARVGPIDRHNRGIHRHCSGCAEQTEHVVLALDGPGSTPAIRRPTADPAIGTTVCLRCGEWRAAGPRPRVPAWSTWPKRESAVLSAAVATARNDGADDWVSEVAAENEGMPPRSEARRPRTTNDPLRRGVAVPPEQ
jgi:hypothetical protein